VTRFRSMLLPISFPYPVIVRHAWVSSARRVGEFSSNLGREFACPPPAYDGRGNVPDAAAPSASPNGAQEANVARSVPPPFSLDCKTPFRGIYETQAAQPTTPVSSAITEKYSVGVEVTVGYHDDILETAIYHSSNREDIDAAALSAQNASSFSSAISYCLKVPSAGVFWAVFGPRAE
jgi:hypothetical protein